MISDEEAFAHHRLLKVLYIGPMLIRELCDGSWTEMHHLRGKFQDEATVQNISSLFPSSSF